MKRIKLLLMLLVFFNACKKNQPPRDLRIECPPFGYKDSLVFFRVKATDPEKEEISYLFDWGDGTQSNWSPFLPSDSFWTDSHRFPDTLKFFIKAIAQDRKGNKAELTKEFPVIGFAPGRVLWRFHCDEDGNFISSPAIDTVDGTIYCACDAGHLHALRPDGSEKWRFSVEEEIHSSPVIDDNRNIIFATDEGGVYCLSPGGGFIWSISLEGEEILSSPALSRDGNIYIGTANNIYCLNSSGQILAVRPRFGGEGLSSPAIDRNGTVFIGGEYFSAYPPDLGAPKWEIPLPDEAKSSPAISEEGNVYFGCEDGRIYKDSLPIYYLSGPVSASPVILGDLIIGCDEEGRIYGFTTTGGDSWVSPFSSGGNPSTPLISDAGILYVVVDYGKNQGEDSLFALALSSGERLWVTPVKVDSYELVSSPAISPEGIIYLGEEGGVVAIVGRGKVAPNGWPMFRGDLRHTGRKR
jgi:outer membrane protein assembly factor BamB